jgi:hypothetical protein
MIGGNINHVIKSHCHVIGGNINHVIKFHCHVISISSNDLIHCIVLEDSLFILLYFMRIYILISFNQVFY